MVDEIVTVFEKENNLIIPLTKILFSDNVESGDIQNLHLDKNELRLENLLMDNPQLVPVDRFNASTWIPVAKQISLEGHYPDIIGVDDTGQLYIIENKLYVNPDKKTVRNQIREYAFVIRKLRAKNNGWQEFLDLIKDANNSNSEDVKRRKNIYGKSLDEILNDKLHDNALSVVENEKKSKDCFQEIKKNFEEGDIILIIAIDKIRKNLRNSIDGENELDGKKLPMFALEVNEYKTKKGEKIIISNTYPFDLDDLIDKKDKIRIINNQEKFDDAFSKAKLSDEQKNNFNDFKNKLSHICMKFNYNTGEDPAIRTKFENTGDRGALLLFARGDLEISIETLNLGKYFDKKEKYKNELEKNADFKKLMDNRQGFYLRFSPDEWMPFREHILSVLKKVFVDE